MSALPMLYSAPMVRAILADTKTQTRRLLKLPSRCSWYKELGGEAEGWAADDDGPAWFHVDEMSCPYGYPGDTLWIKETYFAWGRWETRFSAKKGRDEWHFIDSTLESGRAYVYADDDKELARKPSRSCITPTWWKRPAIFMPRAASRITLEITDRRVERLQDITEADAIAEGTPGHPYNITPHEHYRRLWNYLNAKNRPQLPTNSNSQRYARVQAWLDAHPDTTSWNANPWVWVISFRRVNDGT